MTAEPKFIVMHDGLGYIVARRRDDGVYIEWAQSQSQDIALTIAEKANRSEWEYGAW